MSVGFGLRVRGIGTPHAMPHTQNFGHSPRLIDRDASNGSKRNFPTPMPSVCLRSSVSPVRPFPHEVSPQSRALKLYVPSQCQFTPSVGGETWAVALNDVNF